jgi:phage N-6-adenine-methyltransferase
MKLSPARVSAHDLAALDEMERDALSAIDKVTDPDDAERLLAKVKAVDGAQRLARVGADYGRRWARVRLLTERRYGELLGPADRTKRKSDRLSDFEYQSQSRARQVAAVPGPSFAGYVNGEDEPTRSGLLRAAKGLAPLMSSQTDQWSTPQDLFDKLNAEFAFNLDVCATAENAKCQRYFTAEDDGLAQEWIGTCWMNPPYGDVIGKWVEKARLAGESGSTVVCLVPARVDTAWWWDNCRYGEIRFLRGRLKFGGAETSAPFPSAVVIFGRAPSVIWWER